jgi:hypothetical protein
MRVVRVAKMTDKENRTVARRAGNMVALGIVQLAVCAVSIAGCSRMRIEIGARQ